MLRIGYGGTLGYKQESRDSNVFFSAFRNYFWTYRNNFELSSTRSPLNLFKALQIINEQREIDNSEILVSFWGAIDARYKELVIEMGIENFVEISGFLSKEASVSKLQEQDVLFLPLETGASNHKTLFIPGKVFEYLIQMKPILIDDTSSDCSEIVKKSGLGLFTERGESYALAELLLDLADNPKKILDVHANDEFIQSLSFENRAKEMAEVFNELLQSNIRYS